MTAVPISRWRLAAYASPAMITYLAWMPLGYVVAKFYAKYTSLDLATIGLIIFVGRLFDAFSDPLVAYLSDRFDTRWGRRKPWIVLSAPVFASGFAMLVMPPNDIHWSYFLLANVILYSGWTFFEVSHVAWGLELDRSHDGRTKIAVLLKLFAYIGSLAFFAFPFIFNPDPNSTEFTRPVMTALGFVVVGAFPVLVLFSVLAAPSEQRLGDQPYRLREVFKEIRRNPHLLTYLGGFGAWVVADGVIIGLFIVYVDAFHNLSSAEGIILLAAYLSRVLAAPVAMVMLTRFSRPKFWLGACIANACLYPILIFMPQGAEALPLLVGFAVVAGVIDCAIGILAITLLGDLIDEDAARTRRDKAASYKACVNLAEKSLRALGISGGLFVVGAAGLTIGQGNSTVSLLILVGILAGAPSLLNLISAFTMRRLPFSGPVASTPIPDGAEIHKPTRQSTGRVD